MGEKAGFQLIDQILPVDDDHDDEKDDRGNLETEGDPVADRPGAYRIRDENQVQNAQKDDRGKMAFPSFVRCEKDDEHDQQIGKQNDRDDRLCPAGGEKMVDQQQQNHDVERDPAGMGKDREFNKVQ